MASKVIERKIIELGLDDSTLSKGLQKALDGVKGFENSINNIKADGVDKIGNHVSTIGEKIGNFVSKIPIIGSVAESILGIGRSALTSASQMGSLSGTSLSSISGEAINASDAVDSIGESAGRATNAFNVLAGAASVALGNTIFGLASQVGQSLNKWTFAPIINGYKEYERELESTRVLVGALGEEEQDHITSVMRDLEKYAATTKYNSQQMNSSLAQFVNAGIDIDTAGTALKGWGNLAASAAASTDNFNTSLQFGLQQALSMGYMTRQNWMSIENANMGTRKFKEALVETALAQGSLTQEMVDSYGIQGLFVDGLAKEAWLTNDVMMASLELYSTKEEYLKMAENIYTFGEAVEATEEAVNDAWSRMWVELVGKGDEAMAIWTPVGMAMAAIVTAIPNTITEIAKAFNLLDGRSHLIDALVAGINSIKSALSGIGKAFIDVFPDSQVEGIRDKLDNGIAKPFVNIAKIIIKISDMLKSKLTVDPAVGDAFRSIFTVILNIVDVAIKSFGILAQVLEILIPDNLIQNGIILVGILASLVNAATNFVKGLFAGSDFSKVSEAFYELSQAVSKFYDIITNALGRLAMSISSWSRHTGDATEGVSKNFSLLTPIVWILEALTKGIDMLSKGLSTLVVFIRNIDFSPVAEFTNSVVEFIKLSGVMEKATAVFDGMMKSAQSYFKELGQTLSKIHINNPFETITVSADDYGKSSDNIKSKILDMTQVLETAKDVMSIFTDTVKANIDQNGLLNGVLISVKDGILGIVGGIGLLAYNGLGLDKLWDGLSGTASKTEIANSAMTKFGDFLRNKLGLDIKQIVNEFDNLKERLDITNGALGKTLSTIGNSLKEFFTNLDFSSKTKLVASLFGELGESIKGLADYIGKFSQPISGFFEGLGRLLGDFARGLSDSSLLDTTKLLILWNIINKLTGGASILDRMSEAIKKFKDTLMFWKKGDVGFLQEVKDTMRAYQKQLKAQALKDIAKAILILSGSMFVLSLIPSDKIGDVCKLLGMLALAIAGVSIAIGLAKRIAGGGGGSGGFSLDSLIDSLGFPEAKKLLKKIGTATLLISLAASVAMIVSTFVTLTKFSWEDILKASAAVGIVITELIIASRLAGKGGTLGDAAKLVALALSVKMMVNLIHVINELKVGEIFKGLIVIGALGIIMSGAIKLMSFKTPIGGKSGGSFGTALTIMALSLSIKSMVGLIKEIASISAGDITKGIITIGLLSTIVAASVGLMSGEFNVAGANVKLGNTKLSTALTVMGFVKGVKSLADEVIKLGGYDAGTLYKGTDVITTLAMVIAGCIAIMGLDFKYFGLSISIGKISFSTMLSLAVVVTGLIFLSNKIMELAQVDKASLDNAIEVIATLALIVGALAVVVAKFANMQWADVGGLLVSIGGLILLAGTLMRLTEYSWEDINKGISAIGVIALSIAGLITVAGTFGDITGLLNMVTAAGALWFLADKLAQLSKVDGLDKATESIEIISLCMAGLMVIAKLSGGISTIATLGVAALAILGIASSLKMLADLDGDKLSSAVMSIGIALTAITVAAVALTYTGAIAAVVALAAAMVSMGASAIMFGVGANLTVQALRLLWDTIKMIATDISNLFIAIGEAISSGAQNMPAAMENVWNAITDAWDTFWSKAGEIGSNLIKAIGEGISSTKDWIVEKAGQVWQSIKDFFTGKNPEAVEKGKENIKKYGDGISNAKSHVTGKAGEVANEVMKEMNKDRGQGASGEAFMTKWGEGINRAKETVKSWARNAIEAVRGLFPNSPAKEGPLSGSGWTRLGKSGTAFAEQWGKGLVSGLGSVKDDASDNLLELMDIIDNTLDPDNFSDYSQITPVIKPEVDTSHIRYQMNNLDVSAPLKLEYDRLSNAQLHFDEQQRSIDTIYSGMTAMYDVMNELLDVNNKQIDAIYSDKYSPVIVDGKPLTDTLVPYMDKGIKNYNNQIDRMYGKVADLNVY